MAKMTPARRALVRRRANGTFRVWPGGRTLADLPRHRRRQLQHGIGVHIGAGFAGEHGRRARSGDVFRWRRSDGRFHKQAFWYIRTPHGWRRSPTKGRRPSPSIIRTVIANARPGRPYAPRK